MRNVTIFIILVTFHVFVVREVLLECQPTNQQVLIESYGGITNEFLIWKGFVDSKMDCLKKCFYNFRCITYQYKDSTKACRVYAADIDTLRKWEAQLEVGHVTFQLQGRGGFGENCTLNAECNFLNSECRQSTCSCILSYSFNPVKHACTHGCAQYSNSYEIYREISLFGFDLGYTQVNSIEDCQKSCSYRTNCVSFDYMTSGLCFVKSVGVLDSPGSLTSRNDTTHGVRNCFN